MTPNWQFTLAIVLIAWPMIFCVALNKDIDKKHGKPNMIIGVSVVTAFLLSIAWGLRLLWLLWINPPQLL